MSSEEMVRMGGCRWWWLSAKPTSCASTVRKRRDCRSSRDKKRNRCGWGRRKGARGRKIRCVKFNKKPKRGFNNARNIKIQKPCSLKILTQGIYSKESNVKSGEATPILSPKRRSSKENTSRKVQDLMSSQTKILNQKSHKRSRRKKRRKKR